MAKDIFISYRRKGAKTEAVLLYTKLTEAGYSVFLDYTSLHSGKFTKEIEEAIVGCKDFLLLIHPSAFNRCQNSDDCFRMEIECALREKKNIIPILVNQRNLPGNIPAHMQELKEFNAIPFLPLEYLNSMVERLCSQYLTVQPSDPTLLSEEPTAEMEWDSIPEEKWQVCPLCGNEAIELNDPMADVLENLDECAVVSKMMAGISVTLGFIQIPLLILTKNYSAIEKIIYGVMKHIFPAMVEYLSNDSVHEAIRFLGVLAIPFVISLISTFSEKIFLKYRNIIVKKEEETGTHDIRCACEKCGANYNTEISISELPPYEGMDNATGKLVGFLFALFAYAMIYALGDGLLTTILIPSLYFIGPILAMLLFFAALIIIMLKEFADKIN